MSLKYIHTKNLILHILLICFLCSFTIDLNANSSFPTNSTISVEKKKSKTKELKGFFKKKVKSFRKFIKKVKTKISKQENLFGTIALWLFFGGIIISLLVALVSETPLFIIFFLASLLFAIIGATGGDKKPKRAKIMLAVLLISTILLVILAFLAFTALMTFLIALLG